MSLVVALFDRRITGHTLWFALFSLSLLFLSSCSGKQEAAQIPGGLLPELAGTELHLADLVSARPAAVVSSQSPLEIEFTRPLVPTHMVNHPSDHCPVHFTPSIEGSCTWLTQGLLRFQPAKPLPAGQSYQVLLKGKEAFGKDAKVDDYAFAFKVAEQEILSVDGDFVPDTGAVEMTNLVVDLSFAQPVDAGKVKDLLVLKEGWSSVAFDLRSTDGRKLRLVAKSIARTGKARTIVLRSKSGLAADGEEHEWEFLLPPKGVFQVTSSAEETAQGDDQPSWGIRFSDPVRPGMDLSGFVSVDPEVAVRVSVHNRTLLVRGDFVPGKEYVLHVAAGLPSAYNTRLAREWSATVRFHNLDPMTEWVSKGVFVPADGKNRLQLRTVNLRSIHLQVVEILPQNLGFFLQNNAARQLDNGGDESEYYYWNSGYSDLERVGKVIEDRNIDIPGAGRNLERKVEFDLTAVVKKRPGSALVVKASFGLSDLVGTCVDGSGSDYTGDVPDDALFYDQNDYYRNPCRDGYYYRFSGLDRLFIASSLAATAKKETAGLRVWVTDVETAKPVSGVKLGLYSYQNELLESRATDGQGMALFPHWSDSLDNATVRGEHPRGMVLLQLNHPEWHVERFDIGGADPGEKGLQAFTFAERGVHRPGDTIHYNLIVRDGQRVPTKGLPVNMRVDDPRGRKVFESNGQLDLQGMLSWDIPTRVQDPTGTWSAYFAVGDLTFQRSFKVETVKPNRLKVIANMPPVIAGFRPRLEVPVESRYLFGAPATHLGMQVDAWISEKVWTAPRYPDFLFRSPLRKWSMRTEPLFDAILDDVGKAMVTETLPDLSQAPGPLDLKLSMRVQEKGGDVTEQWAESRIDPFPVLVGVDGRLQWESLQLGKESTFRIVAVSPQGRPVSGRKLTVRVYSNRRFWWWEFDDRHGDFRTHQNTTQVLERQIRSGSGPVEFRFTPEDEALHFLEVTDEGGHSTGLWFYGSRWGRKAGRVNDEEMLLDVRLDRGQYSPGDSLHVSFASQAGGRALVTLERGNQVLARKWVETSETRTIAGFKLDTTALPNVYASVSLVLPHAQAGSGPMRLYGIRGAEVVDPATQLNLAMSLPDKLEPEKDFTVTVTNHSRKPAEFVLFVVDEGLLDLTRFKTPDPHGFFYAPQRLAVRTLDNFEDVVGALLPGMDASFSVGGGDDEVAKRQGNPKARRFEAVALASGIHSVSAGAVEKVQFHMPRYVGSVRAMLVGVSERAYASEEKAVPVKTPLVVLPTVPRVARPGDRFEVPVSVFAMEGGIRSAKVTLHVESPLAVVGESSKDVQFDGMSEKDVSFPVEVKGGVGIAKVRVEARSGSLVSVDEVSLPVEPAAPFQTRVTDTLVAPGSKLEIPVNAFGLAGTHKASVVLSKMPSLHVEDQLEYLVEYPYGCIEQTVSAVFPQLYLDQLVDLSAQRRQEVSRNITAGIARLQLFRLPDGGFRYWPASEGNGGGSATEWGTSWAGHFLLEAKDLGYQVPQDLLEGWKEHEARVSRTWRGKDVRPQAYRLFLLALAGDPEMAAMNLLRETHETALDPLSRRLLASAYRLSGQPQVADVLLRNAPTSVDPYRETGTTWGSDYRDLALMTYLAVRTSDLNSAARMFQRLTESMRIRSWRSTQETGMALLAAGTYVRKVPYASGDVMAGLSMDGHSESIRVPGRPVARKLGGATKTIVVENQGSAPLFVDLRVEGIPMEDTLSSSASGLQLARAFYDEEGRPMDPRELEQGEPFWMELRVGGAEGALSGVALSTLLPSGWEILDGRLSSEAVPQWVFSRASRAWDYVDVRDDRVNWFFDLPTSGYRSWMVRIAPTFSGEYVLPPVTVEAMYHPDYHARIAGARVRVK